MGLVIPLASYAFYSEAIMDWIYKRWPGKANDPLPMTADTPDAPRLPSSAASLRTNKALSIMEEKADYPTIKIDEVLKGIDRQRTEEFKWPLRRRGTKRVSDVDAAEQDRSSIARD